LRLDTGLIAIGKDINGETLLFEALLNEAGHSLVVFDD